MTALVVGLLSTDSGPADEALRSRIRDFTISWMRFKHAGLILEDSSVDAVLGRAADLPFTHCFVLTHGDIVSNAWELGFAKTIEDWTNGRRFLVAGDVLAEEGCCHGISPRCLLVDLETYRRLGRPVLGLPASSLVEVAAPAAGTGDAPVLRPGVGTARCRPRLPGWNLVHTSLENGIPVERLPHSLTRTFLNISPRSDAQATLFRELLGEGIVTRDPDPDVLGPGQFEFLRRVRRQVVNCRRGIFVWNFEDYDDVDEPPPDWTPPLSTLFSVAAGLKTSWILETHGFDEDTELVYFDYSQQALEFKRLLHEEWNGVDYPAFLRALFEKMPSERAFYQLWGGESPEEMDWATVTAAWEREIARWGGERVIAEHWRRARNLRIEYLHCDMLEDRRALIRRMSTAPSSLIWWSNVFFTFYSNWFHTLEERKSIYDEWLRALAEQSPDMLVYGNDYNNAALHGIRAGAYARRYFEEEDDYLAPRSASG